MIFFDAVSRSQPRSSPAHAPISYAAWFLPTSGVQPRQDLGPRPNICTSGSTSSNTSLILFVLVSCAYPRNDERAELPSCHLELASAGSRVNGRSGSQMRIIMGVYTPFAAFGRLGRVLLLNLCLLTFSLSPLRFTLVSRCYLSLS